MSENNTGDNSNEDSAKVFAAPPMRRVVQKGFDQDTDFVDDDEPTLQGTAIPADAEPV